MFSDTDQDQAELKGDEFIPVGASRANQIADIVVDFEAHLEQQRMAHRTLGGWIEFNWIAGSVSLTIKKVLNAVFESKGQDETEVFGSGQVGSEAKNC